MRYFVSLIEGVKRSGIGHLRTNAACSDISG